MEISRCIFVNSSLISVRHIVSRVIKKDYSNSLVDPKMTPQPGSGHIESLAVGTLEAVGLYSRPKWHGKAV